MRSAPRRPVSTILALGIYAPLLVAQDSAPNAGLQDSSTLESGIRAVPISKVQPHYPRNMRMRQAEGWVSLSYVIGTDGKVTDVVIQDVVGPRELATSAARAVKNWTFEPARWNGTPVEQCSNEVNVKFSIKGKDRGATRSNARKIKEISEAIAAGKLAEAESALDALYAQDLNLYEIGFYNLKKAHLAHVQGRFGDEAYYLRNAAVGERIIGSKISRAIYQMKFVAEVRTERIASALDTYEELAPFKDDVGNWKEFEATHSRLVAIRDGKAPVRTAGTIHAIAGEANGMWSHWLLRRSVEFGEIVGALTTFELRCDRKHFTDKVSSGKNWSVPDHWGECTIFVFGGDASKFNLYELPPPVGAVAQGS